MKKPKALKMWIVAKNIDTQAKTYFYGESLKELEEEEEGNWEEISFDEWSSEDLAEIFGNELENANYHSWTWLPAELNRSMENNRVSEKERFNVLLDMYNCWLYA